MYSNIFDAVPFTVRMPRCEDFYSGKQLRPKGHIRIWREGEDGRDSRDGGALTSPLTRNGCREVDHGAFSTAYIPRSPVKCA